MSERAASTSSSAADGGARTKKKLGGLRDSVTSADASGCAPMQGFLRKKSTRGVWQKRWFVINDHYLTYSKDAGGAGAPDAAIDLRQLVPLSPDASATTTKLLTLVTHDGARCALRVCARGVVRGAHARAACGLSRRSSSPSLLLPPPSERQQPLICFSLARSFGGRYNLRRCAGSSSRPPRSPSGAHGRS